MDCSLWNLTNIGVFCWQEGTYEDLINIAYAFLDLTSTEEISQVRVMHMTIFSH
jgi:hypothetical protein